MHMKISIAETLSPNLGLRFQADRFMDSVESPQDPIVIISFREVESISRSFAHQYLLRKKKSRKKIIEQDIPPHIKKMFDIVVNAEKNPPKRLDFKDLPVRKL